MPSASVKRSAIDPTPRLGGRESYAGGPNCTTRGTAGRPATLSISMHETAPLKNSKSSREPNVYLPARGEKFVTCRCTRYTYVPTTRIVIYPSEEICYVDTDTGRYTFHLYIEHVNS